MHAQDLCKRLAVRYAWPEWAFFEQVYRPTKRGVRYADAMALNLWSTRGLEFHGFEIKVDRRDWLRELKNPAKAEEIGLYCDRWWLVAPEKEFVKEGELPEPWGLLVASGEGLKVAKQAPKLPDALPLDRKFVSVLIRHFHEEQKQKQHTDKVLLAEYNRGCDHAERVSKHQLESRAAEVKRLQDAIAAFEKASGVRIDAWNADRIGEAVQMVLRDEHTRLRDRLKQFRNGIQGVLNEVERALTESVTNAGIGQETSQ